MSSHTQPRLSGNAEILSWQSRIRILVAFLAAVAALATLAGDDSLSSARSLQPVATVLLATQAYVLLAVFAATIARRGSVAEDWLVSATLLGDVALILVLTVAVSGPQSLDRALLLAFAATQLNAQYFGARQATVMAAATLAGYALAVHAEIRGGAPLRWSAELGSMAVFALAAMVVGVSQGSLRRRQQLLAQLFHRAEEGDFTDSYDEGADRRPDAVTRLGRSYNRLRGQLASMILTDPLTGCLNRRGFDQALARETARATRAGSSLALLALDIDHFKSINDTLGHLAGDAVLREFGALLLHTARAGDVVARTGGEEFTYVLPDTSAAGAFQLASRLCEVIRAHRFDSGAGGTTLTVSIGVAASDAHLAGASRDMVETLKHRADQALYGAKRGGRDRVRAWASEDEEPAILGV